MKKVTLTLLLLTSLSFTAIQSQSDLNTKSVSTLEKDSLIVIENDTLNTNSLAIETEEEEKEETSNKALVSWYGGKFHGRLTSSGARYNMNELTAAHKTLPFGTKVKMVNPKNGKEVIVKITDRGPFIKKREFDLSKAAFKELADLESGILHIHYEIL